jgi:hypothetical protein
MFVALTTTAVPVLARSLVSVMQYNPELEDRLYDERVRRYREIQARDGQAAADAFLHGQGAAAGAAASASSSSTKPSSS